MSSRFPILKFAVGLIAGMVAQSAAASPVYPGCAEPVAGGAGRAFHVDPAKGSERGDGSQAHPWRTLAEVVADGLFSTMPTHYDKTTATKIRNNPDAPIRPGDSVYLASGDHGAVTIQGAFGKGLVGYANSDFITIAAEPGQSPTLRRLQVFGGSKWVFRGLTIQSENTSGQIVSNKTPDSWLVAFDGPNRDIILDNNKLLSSSDVSGWTIHDWLTRRSSGILDRSGSCVAITHNDIQNVGFGVQTQRSNNVLISLNTINYFSDDGIDYGSDNLIIEGNKISNSIEDGDGFHRDGMQGQPYDEGTVVENVKIRNNEVIRLTDSKLKFPGFLQGIDAFDGIWKRVVVSDNTVITDAWQGISFYGVQDILIEGNILLGDGGKVLPCYGLLIDACLEKSVIYDHKSVPRLVVHSGKSSAPSSDATVAGNVISGLDIDVNTKNVTIRNNLCIETNGGCSMGFPNKGVKMWVGRPGTYGDRNVISSKDAAELFTVFLPKELRYDLKLKRKNPALAR